MRGLPIDGIVSTYLNIITIVHKRTVAVPAWTGSALFVIHPKKKVACTGLVFTMQSSAPGGTVDNSKIFFLISQRKHML